ARNTDEVPQPVVVAARAHWAAFDEKSDALKSALAEQSSVDVAAVQSTAERSAMALSLVTAASAVAVGLLAWLFARAIAGPRRAARTVPARVAEAALPPRAKRRTADDLGDMADALNRTLDRVGSAVARIAGDAGTLTTAAGGLTTVSHQVSTGAEQVTSQ